MDFVADLVSVIIPMYNSSTYITPTILSALNQTYKNIRILINDDASTDGTVDILLKYENEIDEIIKKINNSSSPIVFVLWGASARSKKSLIDVTKHFIVESAHPSPLSAYGGFFGSKPFSKTNEFLIKNNVSPINWVKNTKTS